MHGAVLPIMPKRAALTKRETITLSFEFIGPLSSAGL